MPTSQRLWYNYQLTNGKSMDRLTVEIVTLHHYTPSTLPQYHSEQAAGIDLIAAIPEPYDLKAGARGILIPTGIAIKPRTCRSVVGLIAPRSGLSTKHGIILANTVGIIDADYEGEIKLSLWNSGPKDYLIEPEERLAQLLFMQIYHVDFSLVDQFSSASTRGSGGFNSTGKL